MCITYLRSCFLNFILVRRYQPFDWLVSFWSIMPHSQSCSFYRRVFFTAFILFIGQVTSLNLEVRRVSVLPLQAVCYLVVTGWLIVGIAANVSSLASMNASAKQQHENSGAKKKTRRHCQYTLRASLQSCKSPGAMKCTENEDKKNAAELLYVFCVSHRAAVSSFYQHHVDSSMS